MREDDDGKPVCDKVPFFRMVDGKPAPATLEEIEVVLDGIYRRSRPIDALSLLPPSDPVDDLAKTVQTDLPATEPHHTLDWLMRTPGLGYDHKLDMCREAIQTLLQECTEGRMEFSQLEDNLAAFARVYQETHGDIDGAARRVYEALDIPADVGQSLEQQCKPYRDDLPSIWAASVVHAYNAKQEVAEKRKLSGSTDSDHAPGEKKESRSIWATITAALALTAMVSAFALAQECCDGCSQYSGHHNPATQREWSTHYMYPIPHTKDD